MPGHVFNTSSNSNNDPAYEKDPAVLQCADKLVFDSQRQAAAAANVAEYQHGASLRPYQCRYCGLWHVSSA